MPQYITPLQLAVLTGVIIHIIPLKPRSVCIIILALFSFLSLSSLAMFVSCWRPFSCCMCMNTQQHLRSSLSLSILLSPIGTWAHVSSTTTQFHTVSYSFIQFHTFCRAGERALCVRALVAVDRAGDCALCLALAMAFSLSSCACVSCWCCFGEPPLPPSHARFSCKTGVEISRVLVRSIELLAR